MTLTVQEALQTIVDNADAPALNYAVNYAKYGLHVTDPHELAVQCTYVLNNISHWRHPSARQVRDTLKAYVKEHPL